MPDSIKLTFNTPLDLNYPVLTYNSAVGYVYQSGNTYALQQFLLNMKPHQINSFLGGTIHAGYLDVPLTVYRTGNVGHYWTEIPPKSPWQQGLDLAMHPYLYKKTPEKHLFNWHPANRGVLMYDVPAKEMIAWGYTAPQYGFPGQTPQLFLPSVNTKAVKGFSWNEYWQEPKMRHVVTQDTNAWHKVLPEGRQAPWYKRPDCRGMGRFVLKALPPVFHSVSGYTHYQEYRKHMPDSTMQHALGYAGFHEALHFTVHHAAMLALGTPMGLAVAGTLCVLTPVGSFDPVKNKTYLDTVQKNPPMSIRPEQLFSGEVQSQMGLALRDQAEVISREIYGGKGFQVNRNFDPDVQNKIAQALVDDAPELTSEAVLDFKNHTRYRDQLEQRAYDIQSSQLGPDLSEDAVPSLLEYLSSASPEDVATAEASPEHPEVDTVAIHSTGSLSPVMLQISPQDAAVLFKQKHWIEHLRKHVSIENSVVLQDGMRFVIDMGNDRAGFTEIAASAAGTAIAVGVKMPVPPAAVPIAIATFIVAVTAMAANDAKAHRRWKALEHKIEDSIADNAFTHNALVSLLDPKRAPKTEAGSVQYCRNIFDFLKHAYEKDGLFAQRGEDGLNEVAKASLVLLRKENADYVQVAKDRLAYERHMQPFYDNPDFDAFKAAAEAAPDDIAGHAFKATYHQKVIEQLNDLIINRNYSELQALLPKAAPFLLEEELMNLYGVTGAVFQLKQLTNQVRQQGPLTEVMSQASQSVSQLTGALVTQPNCVIRNFEAFQAEHPDSSGSEFASLAELAQFFKSENFKAAEKKAREMQAVLPQDPDLMKALTESLARQNQYKAAISELETALKAQHDTPNSTVLEEQLETLCIMHRDAVVEQINLGMEALSNIVAHMQKQGSQATKAIAKKILEMQTAINMLSPNTLPLLLTQLPGSDNTHFTPEGLFAALKKATHPLNQKPWHSMEGFSAGCSSMVRWLPATKLVKPWGKAEEETYGRVCMIRQAVNGASLAKLLYNAYHPTGTGVPLTTIQKLSVFNLSLSMLNYASSKTLAKIGKMPEDPDLIGARDTTFAAVGWLGTVAAATSLWPLVLGSGLLMVQLEGSDETSNETAYAGVLNNVRYLKENVKDADAEIAAKLRYFVFVMRQECKDRPYRTVDLHTPIQADDSDNLKQIKRLVFLYRCYDLSAAYYAKQYIDLLAVHEGVFVNSNLLIEDYPDLINQKLYKILTQNRLNFLIMAAEYNAHMQEKLKGPKLEAWRSNFALLNQAFDAEPIAYRIKAHAKVFEKLKVTGFKQLSLEEKEQLFQYLLTELEVKNRDNTLLAYIAKALFRHTNQVMTVSSIALCQYLEALSKTISPVERSMIDSDLKVGEWFEVIEKCRHIMVSPMTLCDGSYVFK